MADSIKDDARQVVEKQIAELREQITTINQTLSKHAQDIDGMKDEAGKLVHGAQKNAQRAASHVQKEASVVARAAQRAPMATSTALTIAAVIGFGLGCLFTQSEKSHHRWF